MVTIKEIAKIANVSAATVSHVLNDSAKISEETRRKVLELVKELNYTPNTIAKSLKLKKTHTIGVIMEDITVFNAPEIINGINEFTEENNYNIILNNIRLYKRIGNQYNETHKYKNVISDITQVLLGKQVDGIIYVGSHFRDVAGILDVARIPVVNVYCYSSEDSKYSVIYDDEKAAFDATNYLIQKGHNKIGLISGLFNSIQCQERFKGYQRALYENHLLYNPLYIKVGNWEYNSGLQYGTELLQMDDRPTAIFAMNDIMAGGVIDAANKMKIKIPDKLSLIGFDNRECSFSYTPRLTTMRLPLNEMGEMSAKVLIGLINNSCDIEQKIIRLQCELIERNSV